MILLLIPVDVPSVFLLQPEHSSFIELHPRAKCTMVDTNSISRINPYIVFSPLIILKLLWDFANPASSSDFLHLSFKRNWNTFSQRFWSPNHLFSTHALPRCLNVRGHSLLFVPGYDDGDDNDSTEIQMLIMESSQILMYWADVWEQFQGFFFIVPGLHGWLIKINWLPLAF